MASDYNNPGAELSLLNRLTDLEPGSKSEARMSAWQTVREFRASLCNDLTALLNTRRADQDFDPAFEEAANSLLTFGVADFTAYNLKSSVDRERVRRSIERAIRQFEPRLAQVVVTVEEPDPLRPALLFQISACLKGAEDEELLLLPGSLYHDSRRIEIAGADS